MHIVVGLGNPGRDYAATRHNVGFAVVDVLAQRWKLPLGSTRQGMRSAQGLIRAVPTMLIQPQMYMNLSGSTLSQLEERPVAGDFVVVHDDLDLERGCVRVKRDGGTGGHRGLDSIVERYGHDFTRVRVGIGRPPRGVDAAEYVLSPFGVDEADLLSAAVQRAADAVECIIEAGAEVAMNTFNVRTKSCPTPPAAETGRE
jgi:peptidyl-tRNA hydrolase, PTH1 family